MTVWTARRGARVDVTDLAAMACKRGYFLVRAVGSDTAIVASKHDPAMRQRVTADSCDCRNHARNGICVHRALYVWSVETGAAG